MFNQNPEKIARDNIDKQLSARGRIVQHKKKFNLAAGLGIAIKEYVTDVGPADYVLFVANKIEKSIAQSMQKAEELRQSISKKAFSGELV
jgi:type I site-specific restriction endonuclease